MPSKLLHPVSPVTITQQFGVNKATYAKFGMVGHNGLDYRTTFESSPSGHRPVRAAADGVVIEVGNQGGEGYGLFVRLGHQDGSQTVYGHFLSTSVKEGQQVAVGQELGISDSTGFSTGPHVHFGYRPPKPNMNNGYKGYVNPAPLMVATLDEAKFDMQFAAKMAGGLLLAVEDRGAVWYVGKDGRRAKIGCTPEEVAAFLQAIRDKRVLVTGITNADIGRIPTV